ncbi:MAG: SPFH domain-containing protein [Oscillospiraceae bacterium]|nr:SPFH domain-containing protein [Oscillospiraceae bacterium]
MGILRAVATAFNSTLADQWKEFFYCDAMPSDVLVMRGQKKISRKSANKKGNDNIITNGSIITVADGQCMIIVDQGRIDTICTQAGAFEYINSSEPSFFGESLGTGIKSTFETMENRVQYGGDAAHDQRVYYFNLKEIMNNKFGTPTPVPFRVVDRNIGLDIDISIRCNGEYSYQITDPLLFYQNVCGNVANIYTKEQLASTLKSEFLTALQPAFARISEMGIRYSALPAHTLELADALNQALSQKWEKTRGIKICNVAINSVSASREDEELMKQAQRTGMLQNPTMAAASLVSAQADAMRNASQNSNGAMMGFMGMNMAQQAGGVNAQQLYQMPVQSAPVQQPTQDINNNLNHWICSCGTQNTGKFCADCGKPKPVNNNTWTCSCGASNTGKFCSECGKQKPSGAKFYRCVKCGWTPENPARPPRFCPECGDIFDNNDLVS